MFTNEPVHFTSFMVQVLSCLCNVVFPGEAFVEVQSEVFNTTRFSTEQFYVLPTLFMYVVYEG